jgi:membrane-bound metal-dependent hydrolase YbcI (DUF457 family)
MFAVGHLALGYLSGKATSKLLNVNMNISIIFVASIIPDIDKLMPYFAHRGATHSAFISVLVFLPAFLLYGKQAAPYFAALTSHSLIGDYLTDGGVQLLWPMSQHWYGGGIEVTSLNNILLESISFLAFLTVMLSSKDVLVLFQRHPTNFLLLIPAVSVLTPTIFSFPLYPPTALLLPHLIYLAFFTIPVLVDLMPAHVHAICNRMVEAHCCSITGESTIGKGSISPTTIPGKSEEMQKPV